MWNCSRYVSSICYVCLAAFNDYTLLAFGMKTITLEVIQPSTGPVCPGQDAILTCTVARTGFSGTHLYLTWNYWTQVGSTSLTAITYDSGYLQSGPLTLGDFITTAVFMSSTTSKMLASNATLTSAAPSNSNSSLSCHSPPQDNTQTATIIVAGLYSMSKYCVHFLIKLRRCR